MKTSSIARGTRVKVTFFATGQCATVNKSKWIVLSNQTESKIKTDKLAKNATFRAGLEQMKSLRNHLLSDSPVTSSGIGFDPQIGGRRFRILNKDHLQAEEEENTRKMEKKMFQKDGSMLWYYAAGTIHGKVHMLPILRFLTLQIKINIPKQKWQG